MQFCAIGETRYSRYNTGHDFPALKENRTTMSMRHGFSLRMTVLICALTAALLMLVPAALAQDSAPLSDFAATATALAGGSGAQAQASPTTAPLSDFAATATALAGAPGTPATSTPPPTAEPPILSDFAATATALADQQGAAAPTAEPTPAPTTAPTLEPTAEPTPAPSAEVTEAPAAAPTAEAVPTELPTPAPAAPPAAEPPAAQGVSTLVLLLGLGAALAVGGLTLMRDRQNKPDDEQ